MEDTPDVRPDLFEPVRGRRARLVIEFEGGTRLLVRATPRLEISVT
jgi:hypothetical protein